MHVVGLSVWVCSVFFVKLFFLINSYTTGFQASVLSNMLLKCVSSRHGGIIDAQELCLPVTTGGVLPCGASGRWSAE